jgi:integral membrane protein
VRASERRRGARRSGWADNAGVNPNVLRSGLVKAFRIAAIAEAFTWLGLLIGMFFKYIVVHNQFGVQVFGPTHGFVMGFYILTVFLVKPELPWGRRELLIGLGASVPPFATYFFERWVVAQANELDRVDAAARPADQPG